MKQTLQQANSGVLIYALNLDRMAQFYQAVLKAQVLHVDAEHQVLQSLDTQLIIHAIPTEYRPLATEQSQPATPRSEQAIKPFFTVQNLAVALEIVLQNGGQVLGMPYNAPNLKVQNVADPEGNIIHLRERIQASSST